MINRLAIGSDSLAQLSVLPKSDFKLGGVSIRANILLIKALSAAYDGAGVNGRKKSSTVFHVFQKQFK